MKNSIEKLITAFKNPTNVTKFGCEEDSIEHQINRCREIDDQKSYCVIKSWCLWILNYPKDKNQGELPATTLIKSDYVIDDEFDRFPIGSWVRSSPIIGLHQDCIFETKNTFYIAVGPGGSKTIDTGDALAFF